MDSMSTSIGILILLFLAGQTPAEVPHRRFEYKFSFKPPYLAQRDGSVPFWKYGGSKYLYKRWIFVDFEL